MTYCHRASSLRHLIAAFAFSTYVRLADPPPAGNARALAEEDSGNTSHSHSNHLSVSTSSMTGGSSPRRQSFAPGNTTKVLADLQAGVLNAKNALENTKAQLRVSQRQVSQLTRQTEDLKEVRERLRLENEGLNNVVARKERLLQEVRPIGLLGGRLR